MNKKVEPLDAFDAVANELTSMHMTGPEPDFDIESKEEDLQDPEDNEEEGVEVKKNIKLEEEEIKEEVKDSTDKVETKEVSDLSEYDSDIADYVTSKLETKLGFSIGEVKTVDDILDRLSELVEESTSDVFADEEIEKLNEFVKNGGKLREFYSQTLESKINPDDLDIENTSDQKRVIKENLKNNGYSEKQVERMVSRYEDAGTLQDEAEDALEVIKEYNKKNKEKLLAEQEKVGLEHKKVQQKFIFDVQDSIKKLSDIRGISISDKDKKELFQYIFVPESDGKTKYQTEYSSNVKHLLESAFFTMRGDVLIDRAQKKGASDTAKALKDKLSQKGNRIKKSNSEEGKDIDAMTLFARGLRKL